MCCFNDNNLSSGKLIITNNDKNFYILLFSFFFLKKIVLIIEVFYTDSPKILELRKVTLLQMQDPPCAHVEDDPLITKLLH